MNLVGDLQRLYLAEEEFVDAKTLLNAPKIMAKEKKLLEEWIDNGYIKVVTVGNKSLYGLADEGKKVLERHNPERWRELRLEKARRDNQQLQIFLALLKKKSGTTPLTAAEQKQFARHLDLCLGQKTIEKSGADCYRLTGDGEALLLSLSPIPEILNELEHYVHTVEEELNKPTQNYNNFVQKLQQEQPQLEQILAKEFGAMAQHLEQAMHHLDEIRRQVEAVQIAHEWKAILQADMQQARETFPKLVQEIRMAAEQKHTEWCEAQQKILAEEQQRLKTEYQRLWQKLDGLDKLYSQVALLLTQRQ